MVCKRDNNKLKIRAIKNPSTPNPLTNASASKIITALITSKNSPKVTIVTGNVNITKIGFTIKLRTAKTIATIIAVTYPATVTPGKNFANKTTATAVNRMRIKNFIFKFFINRLFNKNAKKTPE